ncbi:LacI family DNA-binding transcriptional regulator [Microbacterium ulmi]|uniref:LacI family DNA-binding transcriptional regulator n=1 Tax=Microbacterium ulmi TaxID=179095 RepID=A0A7Y2LZF3_9MICO|nr:LacI family DNA-binding transcriptional regulator [Microbacterium ulmi]NII69166.1 LacI family transcriptional regulator [Microbacterium ulmi]NNH03706.1 LacI family DNA-binding transcriptional regulator [Microbacterium ulmi]
MARITIEDVASEAGVSVTTVSHVFSGNRPVSTETQIIVREVATRLGYHPNAIAQSLRSQRTNTIMIVVPDITNSFYPDYARSLQDVAAEAGFHSLLCNTDAREAEELAFLDEAMSRRLDGVVFTGFRVPPSGLEPLVDAGIAVVCIGSVPTASPLDSVRFDDRAAAAEATGFILERYGHRVALIYGDEEAPVGRERRLGFEQACRAAGIPREDLVVVLEEFNRAGGRRGMARLLARPERPRAVVCANDMIALGAVEVARDAGMRIPEDIAIVGHDDVDVATVVTPRLTTVRTDARRLGAEAGALLVSRMTGAYTGPGRHVTIPHELIVRESA